MAPRITLVATSARVAPGLLTAAAWDLLRSVPVWTANPAHPQLAALRAAGVEVSLLRDLPDQADPVAQVRAAVGAAVAAAATAGDPAAETAGGRQPEQIAWLLDPVTPNAADQALREAGAAAGIDLLTATQDLPGSALLDAVAVMDRLRSPGGCPWDARQTHASLAPYLLEEAYEAYQAIEDGDLTELREELGDVLMQVLFHARVAAEAGPQGWDVDDVATGLAAKLIRRHPHVFGDVAVSGADEVVTNWDAIKAQEKSRKSVTEGVPLSAPALSLTAKLLRRALKLGFPLVLALPPEDDEPGRPDAPDAPAGPSELVGLAVALARGAGAGASAGADGIDEEWIGELLFAAAALAGAYDVDPEAALRGRARAFRDRLARAEHAALDGGQEPARLDAAGWGALWESAGPATASAPVAAPGA
ncbi:nucleoside triphosphate hydrolase [Parafrankia colletiae]|uniref:Nucleoside triphosphate hydrolase n=1 Tax=Parafrankia colletiae TaxID=573497 RepID=A0A1S1Q971_9ACTN|nr:MazG family protein [Parafrankia colletiae]MCK9900336.1 MazG family protein [Frankia sp. Cpl3]OHV30510.1 nucleoside triphosphate hydrolase [Parafrankia colletiae]